MMPSTRPIRIRATNRDGVYKMLIFWSASGSLSLPQHKRLERWWFSVRLASLSINDDTEIDWKLLNDPDWNLWSAHQLQRRFQTLKKSVKGHESMSFHGDLQLSLPPRVLISFFQKSWIYLRRRKQALRLKCRKRLCQRKAISLGSISLMKMPRKTSLNQFNSYYNMDERKLVLI
jgi:hypothetical protein